MKLFGFLAIMVTSKNQLVGAARGRRQDIEPSTDRRYFQLIDMMRTVFKDSSLKKPLNLIG